MEDLFWLLKTLRRAESLLLPFFPGPWRRRPPSYRIVTPLLDRLERHKDQHDWIPPLLFKIRKDYYRAYHQDGLGPSEFSEGEAAKMRLVSGIVILVLLAAIAPWARVLSPWVKGGLLWGGSLFLLHSLFRLRISILWAAWGLLFQPVVYPAAGVPWVGLFITAWVLLWHASMCTTPDTWKWHDALASLPIFFFWVFVTRVWLSTWPHWQSALLATGLWILCWILMFRDHGTFSRALVFFWPATLTATLLIATSYSLLKKLGLLEFRMWLVWLGSSLVISFLALCVARWRRRLACLRRMPAVIAVFAVYAAMLAFSKKISNLEPIIDTQFRMLYLWSWPIWWVAGAGMVFYARKLSMFLFQWIQVFLSTWTLPLATWALIGWAFWMGYFSRVQSCLGLPVLASLCLVYAVGCTILAWRDRETASREWLFAGFFVFFLIDQYFGQMEHMLESLDRNPPLGTLAFVGLSIGLLWMSFDFVGARLKDFTHEHSSEASVATVGCVLWFLLAMLWISHVDHKFALDQQYSVQSNIAFDMSVGLTLLGIPMMIYQGVARLEMAAGPGAAMPWAFIIVAGIVPAQVLQGVEHYMAAIFSGQSGDVLHKSLLDAIGNLPLLESLTPAIVSLPKWQLAWRAVRWLASMALFTGLIVRSERGQSLRYTVLAASFTSLAVGTAEFTAICWPTMPLEWSVVLRPWVVKTVIWDQDFLKFYSIYGLSGLLWGWLLSSWRTRRA